MHQLTGMDAAFLYMETHNSPMHISGLSIYDQSTAPGGKVRFKEIIDNFSQRLLALPTMTRRLVEVPLGLDYPYWVSDGSYDPEFHVRHIALPKPGDWRQLCILISRLQARPLDRSRPLWEVYVIEGLDNVEGAPKDSFAIFTKTHHAAIDGASGVEMSQAVHDLSPDYKSSDKRTIVTIDNSPTKLELLARAQINFIKKPFQLASVMKKTLPSLAKTFMATRRGELSTIKNVPRTRFNTKVSPHRVFEAATFDLQDIKNIKNALPGATINDVAVAIVGGALRQYLEAHTELPNESLVAMAPVNVRDDSEKGTGGNIVSTLSIKIGSDIADPLKRLAAVNKGTVNAKAMAKSTNAKAMTDYSQFIPSMLTAPAAQLASNWRLVDVIKPLFNCIITNVPGPQVPLYSTGAKMVSNFATGPIVDGVGLFQVIGSYCGQFVISATSCRDMMPDPGFYKECLQASFTELKLAVEKKNKKPLPKAPSKATKKAKNA